MHSLVPGTNAHVLPPAIDLSGWRAADGPRDPARASLLFLGRLEARKGVTDLLTAWTQVADRLPQADLTIAGDGPLLAQVKACRAPRLRYVPRPDDAAAKALFGAADLFLAPAAYGESFGIVLTEAMSAGAVPIAAANPGYASVMTGPGADLLITPGDAAALATKIVALVENPGLRQDMRAWGRSRAIEFDISTLGPQYERLFRQVLDRA